VLLPYLQFEPYAHWLAVLLTCPCGCRASMSNSDGLCSAALRLMLRTRNINKQRLLALRFIQWMHMMGYNLPAWRWLDLPHLDLPSSSVAMP
jgi:hypothetical protein